MPTFKLDDREIPFDEGDSVIKAAWRQGIEIPHYCWHPGLSVAANCRMCLVEVKSEWPTMLPILGWSDSHGEFVPTSKPKLTPACQTDAREGMEVFSKNENVLRAQKSVQEFLLLNHPVDCPICDQAGECKLQDYWQTSQGSLKRKQGEPVHKPKGVRFGPTIVYDAERCIVCTRCVRVCEEVVGDHVLDLRERGNRNEVVLSPGRQLDNKYTLMTEHVCPVGALTSRDFRFKARVWFLRTAPSVCTGCASGCNSYLDYDPRVNRVYRMRPRDNEDVNKFWMCDDGMMTYQQVRENRVTACMLRVQGGEANGHEDQAMVVSRARAVSKAAEELARLEAGRVGLVLSAQYCSEDNFALATLGSEVLASNHMYLAARAGWEGDNILRDADNNPNRAGARRVAGQPLASIPDLLRDVEAGRISALLVLGAGGDETEEQLAPLAKLGTVLCLASHFGPLAAAATAIVPVTCFAEMEGTFVNRSGLAQRFKRAVHAPVGVVPAWQIVGELAQALHKPLPYSKLPELRSAMTANDSTVVASAGAGA